MTRNIPKLSRLEGWGGNTGTATTRAFRQAKNATMKSRDGGYTRTALRDKARYRIKIVREKILRIDAPVEKRRTDSNQ
jgi:hypothetical protein